MRFLRDNGLTLVVLGLFAISFIGQAVSGYYVNADDLRMHGHLPPDVVDYLGSGHFLESVFENWESEFLQMALFVVLTAALVQRGSAESNKPPDERPRTIAIESTEHQPASPAKTPWPVRAGGIWLFLYERSLSLALGGLFVISFVLHAVFGLVSFRADRVEHHQAIGSFLDYVAGPEFWFESFQNWQSEFLSVGLLVVLTIFLRQRGSAQSKPVAAPHSQTGID